MAKMKTCSKCGGSGELDHCGRCDGTGKVRCSTCGGSGEIKDYCRACDGVGLIRKTRLKNCGYCHGRGEYRGDGGGMLSCHQCDGTGQVEESYCDVCPNCNGAKYFSTRECEVCNGTGKVTCPTCHGTNAHVPSTCDKCGGTGKVEVESYSSSSSSSSSSEGGWIEASIGLLVLIALCWGGWRGCKWLFGERGGSEVITEAEIMEKWEEHLEKRREAFDDGKSEKEVEAKGLRNYTWDEWQEKFKKEHEAQAKQEGSDKTRAREIGEQALSTAKDLGDKVKELWQNREQNQNNKPVEKEVKQEAKSLRDVFYEYHDIRRDLYANGHTTEQIHELGIDNLDFKEFSERYKDKDAEEELKKLKDRIAELDAARNNSVQQSSASMPKVEEQRPAVQSDNAEPMVEKPKPVANPNVDKAKLVEQRRAEQQKVGGKNPVALGSGNSAGSGQPNNTGNKASKDFKDIRITVQGKGKTKEAAVRWAIREAVWRTVGTWVDSKDRIQENREKVVAQVKTVTEADVPKYEFIDSQKLDGDYIVKMRVSVSKKKIAPKFADIFPDVFGNVNE